MIYGIRPEILILIVMFGAYILWQIMRAPKRGSRTPFQEDLIARGEKQSEFIVRQTIALERIAVALEKFSGGHRPDNDHAGH